MVRVGRGKNIPIRVERETERATDATGFTHYLSYPGERTSRQERIHVEKEQNIATRHTRSGIELGATPGIGHHALNVRIENRIESAAFGIPVNDDHFASVAALESSDCRHSTVDVSDLVQYGDDDGNLRGDRRH